MTDKKAQKAAPEAVSDEALDSAVGGIALLLPAVQSAREAGRKTSGSKLLADDIGGSTKSTLPKPGVNGFTNGGDTMSDY